MGEDIPCARPLYVFPDFLPPNNSHNPPNRFTLEVKEGQLASIEGSWLGKGVCCRLFLRQFPQCLIKPFFQAAVELLRSPSRPTHDHNHFSIEDAVDDSILSNAGPVQRILKMLAARVPGFVRL